MNPYYDSYNRANQYFPSFFSYGYLYSPYVQSLNRQLPTVNPAIFMNSAKEMEELMKDAGRLLTKIAASKQFSYELMSAAQASKVAIVTNMIKSTGVKKIPRISYTPDGLHLDFKMSDDNSNCCILTLKLRWM